MTTPFIIRHYLPLGVHCGNPGDHIAEVGAIQAIQDGGETYLIGTPWFWSQCSRSIKYAWLDEQTRAPGRYVAVGIGSCYALNDTPALGEDTEICQRIWSRFAKIIVRDPVSHSLLNEIGIESVLLPCPSTLYPIENRPFYCGRKLYIDAPRWYPEMETELSKVKIHEEYDVFRYIDHGAWDLAPLNDMLNFILGYEQIVSARLHGLLPIMCFRKTAIVQVDTRATAATHFGVTAWPNAPKQVNLTRSAILDMYRKELYL